MLEMRIFISYRRDDLDGHAVEVVERISDCLEAHYGGGSVVMDVDTLSPVERSGDPRESPVVHADVLLAVMGNQWLWGIQAHADEEDDHVRLEIESALENSVPVVPLLIGDVRMPQAVDLPLGLAAFAECHAYPVEAKRELGVQLSRVIADLDLHFTGRKGTWETGDLATLARVPFLRTKQSPPLGSKQESTPAFERLKRSQKRRSRKQSNALSLGILLMGLIVAGAAILLAIQPRTVGIHSMVGEPSSQEEKVVSGSMSPRARERHEVASRSPSRGSDMDSEREKREDLSLRVFRVPPSFFSNDSGVWAGAAAGDPFADLGDKVKRTVIKNKTPKSAKEILEGAGVTFPLGSSVTYQPSHYQLIVRNTPENLGLVEAYLTWMSAPAKGENNLTAPPIDNSTQSPALQMEFQFQVYRMDPKMADTLQAQLIAGGEASVQVLARMPDLVRQQSAQLKAEVNIQATSGQMAKGGSSSRKLKLNLRDEDLEVVDGLEIEIDPVADASGSCVDLCLSAEYSEPLPSEGRNIRRLISAFELKAGIPVLICRWQEDEISLLFIGSVKLPMTRAEAWEWQRFIYVDTAVYRSAADAQSQRNPVARTVLPSRSGQVAKSESIAYTFSKANGETQFERAGLCAEIDPVLDASGATVSLHAAISFSRERNERESFPNGDWIRHTENHNALVDTTVAAGKSQIAGMSRNSYDRPDSWKTTVECAIYFVR